VEILKERTTGICSICYDKVPAAVVAEDDKAVIKKECPRHGVTSGVVEVDLPFYRRICSLTREKDPFIKLKGRTGRRASDPYYTPYSIALPVEEGASHKCLMINATHACNLQCKMCYLPDRDTANDLPTEEIKRAIREFPGTGISFSGGEPTLREDLCDLIAYARECRKYPYIVTNGLRLGDWDLLMKLKKAGLKLVNFSLNGLEEKCFTEIENAPLLDRKLKALENVREAGILAQLSFTMIRGVNDDQLRPILQFILKNNHFIYQLRARVGAGVGRRISEKDIYLSQFIGMFAEAVNVDRDALVNYWLERSAYPNVNLFAVSFTDFLLHQDGETFSRLAITPPGAPLQAALFSWPERDNLDFEEIEGLDLELLTSEGRKNFFEAVIMNERRAIL
jgi:pyruvate-formate lyase-activating enzyme